jgi:predicted Rossmann-fold nucleotide-binding protein
VDGFYDGLMGFVRHQQEEGFVRPGHAGLMQVDADADALVKRLREAAGVK